MKKPMKNEASKGKLITFRIKAKLAQKIEKAIEATGLSQSELITSAVERNLPQVVSKVFAARKQATAEFFAVSGVQAPDTSPAAPQVQHRSRAPSPRVPAR